MSARDTAPGPRTVVVGGGFAGLATAGLLARDGHRVTLLERGAVLGGRAGRWSEAGFTFDTGPSWYLMPEVIDRDEDLARHREERLAGRRQLEPAGDPGEQGQAQLTLKPLQLPTERGLHEIQADRGPRDRADLGHRDEGPEQFLVHAG